MPQKSAKWRPARPIFGSRYRYRKSRGQLTVAVPAEAEPTNAETAPPPPSDIKIVRALQYANEWLRYGELKHGALLTLTGVTLGALNNFAKPDQHTSLISAAFFYITVFCGAATIAACLYSFYARVNPDKILNPPSPKDMTTDDMKAWRKEMSWADLSAKKAAQDENWVFFGSLAMKDAESVFVALVGPYDKMIDGGYLFHMAQQVVVNSRLALFKARCFNNALAAYAATLIAMLLSVATKSIAMPGV